MYHMNIEEDQLLDKIIKNNINNLKDKIIKEMFIYMKKIKEKLILLQPTIHNLNSLQILKQYIKEDSL